MNTKRPTTSLMPLAFAVLVGMCLSARAQSAFQPGEILVNEVVSSSVQRYSSAGTLTQTFTGTGTQWAGASITPGGSLVTAYGSPNPGGIDIFAPTGTQTTTFAATGNGSPEDVSVFASGTLALNDLNHNTVQFFSQSGTLLNTVSLSGLSGPLGNTVGSDGILYVAGLGTSNIGRVNSNGTLLGTFSLAFQPGDLVMNPVDGTLWVSGYTNQLVTHVKTDGTVLGSFSTGFNTSGFFVGIGLAPDDNSLYVTSSNSTVVKHFDLNGTLLGSFSLTTPSNPGFLTVVPTVPEPATWAMLGVGAALLLAAMRFRRRA